VLHPSSLAFESKYNPHPIPYPMTSNFHDSSIKGPSSSGESFDGSPLRIAIVHARWNKEVIDALLSGAIAKLKAMGVKEANIVVQSVPGSFELPFACSKCVFIIFFLVITLTEFLIARVISASHIQPTSSGFTDLLGLSDPASRSNTPALGTSSSSSSAPTAPNTPFDAVIAIGVLIKGSTMHFEYICDSVSHALMKLQMDSGVPVIFGVLTALTDDQALERAGLGRGEKGKGHNHGEDWAAAAVEMGCRVRGWGQGKFS
jgi:6,7-dimethyl-8-ribityllumazine synthase